MMLKTQHTSGIFFNSTRDSQKPIPLSMRIDPQIRPGSSSSSSGGLSADIDMGTRRPRRDSETEDAVQKLKDMSATETKGDGQYKKLSEVHNLILLIFNTRVIGNFRLQAAVQWNPDFSSSR